MNHVYDIPKEVKSFQFPFEKIDVNQVFRFYKYAIPEHSPIKLSNGSWLHTYRLTRYDEIEEIHGSDEQL